MDGAFDAWIERDFRDQINSYADQSFFEDPDFHPEKTLGTPATTRRTIAVANYRHAPPVVDSARAGGADARRPPQARGRRAGHRHPPRARRAAGRGPFRPAGRFPMRVSMSGTSMASPHVAGIVALMLQKEPLLTAAQIAKILVASARPGAAGGAAFDVGFGFGLVDAERAVALV